MGPAHGHRGAAIRPSTCAATATRSLASSLGKKDTFDGAVAAFATDYADLSAGDHAALGDALRDGRLATS